MGTGWFAAEAANVAAGMTVAVVGDGAVGLVRGAGRPRKGAERIIAMSRHEPRQKLAREFGATDIVTERGDDGVAVIKEMTEGSAPTRCWNAWAPARPCSKPIRAGAFVGFVGVPHDAAITGEQLFSTQVGLRGGPAPVRHSCPR